uniref:glycosyltransferase family 2 protein n=1 Tax=Lachnospira eligens TaxID=39485 RepID=UPI003FEF49BE
MGKLLSFAIPCYNSAEYMEHCINTVLAGGDEVEVIIVDDGSTKDNTYEIAKRYEKEYPDIVKAVHQENGGHGEAVNTGLKHATGRFFKVVDSDDWVDGKSYKRMLATLRSFEEGSEPDMVIANYVYEKVGAKRKKVIHYENVFPVEQMFTWDDINIGDFKVDQNILVSLKVAYINIIPCKDLLYRKYILVVDNFLSLGSDLF